MWARAQAVEEKPLSQLYPPSANGDEPLAACCLLLAAVLAACNGSSYHQLSVECTLYVFLFIIQQILIHGSLLARPWAIRLDTGI